MKTALLDPLSDVLRAVKLSGALFFGVNASTPWAVEIPEAPIFTSLILPRARHVISYHVITEGSGFARIPGQEACAIAAGDILVIPHQSAYEMHSSPGNKPELSRDTVQKFFADMMAGKLPFVISEGGGGPERAQFICGFLGCDAAPFNPLLQALPPLMLVKRPEDGKADLLDRLIALTLAELSDHRTGGECMRLGLSELVFVETVRRYLASLPEENAGWLGALRHPSIGRAIALLHSRPSHDWKLKELANEAGMSRSVLAKHFAELTGFAPMQYLWRWRMQLASRRLRDGTEKVAFIGQEVGYQSEAAFSRSFKKITGLSPQEWRETQATIPAQQPLQS